MHAVVRVAVHYAHIRLACYRYEVILTDFRTPDSHQELSLLCMISAKVHAVNMVSTTPSWYVLQSVSTGLLYSAAASVS